ncbi:MAG: BufA1 family periplasmic bufferin-type metallophore [Alphaproteobacteria bacterium]
MTTKKTKILTTTGIIAAALMAVQNAEAHKEPRKGDGMEKCYGVVKAGKNDCASKANKHSCSGQSKIDGDPNEWIKIPQGLCEKLVNGSTEPKDQ